MDREVILAKHLPTYTQVAVKALQKAHHTVADIRSEFLHAINTLNSTYVVMEYLEGKDLGKFIREEAEEKARLIFSHLSSAVNFLNQRRITHCGIKLENILLDELGQVKH
ncbi:LOW QUALITY PROTEIN: hypothetical protein U0070_013925 [Myodes glareolus]|uniref:non-specific serine/threonine protein kinase n=1 Tax=Myodes glareolus TaxID=447135 RepID=A0AAW0H0H7_MYOGA